MSETQRFFSEGTLTFDSAHGEFKGHVLNREKTESLEGDLKTKLESFILSLPHHY